MSQEVLNDVFKNLKVLSSLQENQRLLTESPGGIKISPPSTVQAFKRWYFSEDRTKNVDVITSVFDNAFALVDSAIQREEAYQRSSDTTSQRDRHTIISRLSNWQLIKRGRREIASAIKGVENLITTYNGDSNIIARIQLLVDQTHEKIHVMDKNLEFLSSSAPESDMQPQRAERTQRVDVHDGDSEEEGVFGMSM